MSVFAKIRSSLIEPHIRFYAGCPLSLDGQNILGTLCVMDTTPRFPIEQQLMQLRRMGKVVEGLIIAHQATLKKEEALAQAEAEHQLAVRDGELLEEVANVSGVGGWELDLRTNEMSWTQKTREIHEVPDDYRPTVEMALAFYPLESRSKVSNAVDYAIANQKEWDIELPFCDCKRAQHLGQISRATDS